MLPGNSRTTGSHRDARSEPSVRSQRIAGSKQTAVFCATWGWGALLAALFLISAILFGGCSQAGDGAGGSSTDESAAAQAESVDVSASPDASGSPDASASTDASGSPDASASTETGETSAAPADSTAQTPKKKGFLANLFGGGGDEEAEEEEEVVPVEIATVAVKDMPAYLGTTATLEPEKAAEVLTKISGEVQAILVEEGDWVAQDQVLARLDGRAQRVSLQETKARCRAIELDLVRIRKLFDQDVASEKGLHDARYAFEEAEAQKQAAELQLEYTEIKAPFAGVIAERFVDPGQTVAEGTELFSIVDQTPLLVRIHLPERQAQRIAPGQTVVISPDTEPDARVPGQVVRIAPIVDARTGTVKVTCEVDANDYRLRPGSFVRVNVQTDLREGVMVIPKRALVSEGAETFVFRAVADTVSQVPVTTGLTNHTHIQVTAGLEAGDRVVTVGHGALKTGARIREVVEPPAAVADSSPGY